MVHNHDLLRDALADHEVRVQMARRERAVREARRQASKEVGRFGGRMVLGTGALATLMVTAYVIQLSLQSVA